jgi:adenine nucleotide transporter 17
LERARIEMQSAAARDPLVKGIQPIVSPPSQIFTTNHSYQDHSGGCENSSRYTTIHSLRAPGPRQQELSESPQNATVHYLIATQPSQQESASNIYEANKVSLTECLKRLWERNELYRGVKPVISTLAASQFIFFYLNALMRKMIVRSSNSSRSYQLLVASCLAGVANVVLTNPLWVVNTRIVVGDSASLSFLTEMRQIVKSEGLRHLWSGTVTSLLLVSNPVIQFFAYEELKGMLLVRKSGSALALLGFEAFVLGALSKAVATVLTYPLQLAQVVLRLQHHEKDNRDDSPAYRGTLDCLIRLYKRDGLEGLFTGMRAKLVQTVLTAAFTFLTYEQILKTLHATHVTFLQRKDIIFSIAKQE